MPVLRDAGESGPGRPTRAEHWSGLLGALVPSGGRRPRREVGVASREKEVSEDGGGSI